MQISGSIAIAFSWFIDILRWTMLIRAIMSWFPSVQRGFIFAFVTTITEPFVSPIRRLLQKTPLGQGMMDFSFIIAFILLILIQAPVANFIRGLPF